MKKIILSLIILFSAVTLAACSGDKNEVIEDPGFTIGKIDYYVDGEESKEKNRRSLTSEENTTQPTSSPGWSISKGKALDNGWLLFDVTVNNPNGYYIDSFEVEIMDEAGIFYVGNQGNIINTPNRPDPNAVIGNLNLDNQDSSSGVYSSKRVIIENKDANNILEGNPVPLCVYPRKLDVESITFDTKDAKSINLKIKSIKYVLVTPEVYLDTEDSHLLKIYNYGFEGNTSGEFRLFNEDAPKFNANETEFSYDLLTHAENIEAFTVTIGDFDLPIFDDIRSPDGLYTYKELLLAAEKEDKEIFDSVNKWLSEHDDGVTDIKVSFIYKSGDFDTTIDYVVKDVPVSNIIDIIE